MLNGGNAEVKNTTDTPRSKTAPLMLTPQQPSRPTQAFTPACPVCGAQTVQVYDRNDRRLFACAQCDTDVIVPLTAWALASKRNRDKGDS